MAAGLLYVGHPVEFNPRITADTYHGSVPLVQQIVFSHCKGTICQISCQLLLSE